MLHLASQLETLFADCFLAEHATVLRGGGSEPVYLPSKKIALPSIEPHVIVYRTDYFASALHEVAHWCIASAARRELEDYGYWYEPDGRDAAEQAAFERVEARPQALEWIFSDACGFPFHISVDNLEGESGASQSFLDAVARERGRFEKEGLPNRARQFRDALVEQFAG